MRGFGYRRVGRGAVAAALTLAVGGVAVQAVATPVAPRLAFLQATNEIELHRYGGGPINLDLGLYVASPDGPFVVRVQRRHWDSPFTVVQLVTTPGGVVERDLPGVTISDLFRAFQDFAHVRVVDDAGRTRYEGTLDFCPNSWGRERINDSGPQTSAFPQYCSGSVWTKGMIYGIDRAWAVPLVSGFAGPPVELDDGHYRAVVTIAPAFASVFGIAHPQRSVGMTLMTDAACLPFCGGGTTTSAPQQSRPVALHDGELPAAAQRAGRLAVDPNSRSFAPPYPRPTRNVATTNRGDLPDLVALPSWGMSVQTIERRDYLSFAATVGNLGGSILDVEGFRRPESGVMDAYQYFIHNGTIVGSQRVGEMMYDPRIGHQHWHFLDFAAYSLTDDTKHDIAVSGKQAFCIAPTDPIDLTLAHADLDPGLIGLGSACGQATSIWTRESMPVGWADTYGQSKPGQAFDITDLPNGSYYVKVVANPLGHLVESNAANNVSYRHVILGGEPGARTVTVPPYQGLDTEVSA